MPGYPSAPMQGYPPAGPSVPLPTMLLNVGFALEVLGLVLGAMNGFMESPKRAIATLASMCIGVGLVLIAFSLTTQSLKDKEIGTAVRVTALIAAVLLLFAGSGFPGR
ncbi:MAG: hypothetical protein EXR73_08715 [Myxococcales bacterium]|nr:hypothetical protein [Myxococcales bacterium]